MHVPVPYLPKCMCVCENMQLNEKLMLNLLLHSTSQNKGIVKSEQYKGTFQNVEESSKFPIMFCDKGNAPSPTPPHFRVDAK